MKNEYDVFLVKAREHKEIYIENIEDVKIGYVDAILSQNSINVKILDFAFSLSEPDEDIVALKETIKKYSPKVIIFFLDKHPTNSPANTIELLDVIIEGGLKNDSHISLYGNTHVNCFELFSHDVDSVILGEEKSVLSLVKTIMEGKPISEVKGIAFINENKEIHVTEVDLTEDLDSLPFPSRYAFSAQKNYCASILSSRGCFGKCKYCYLRSKELYFKNYGYRARSIKNVVDEIESLYKKGVTEFYFSDDEFLQFGNCGIKRAKDFSDELIRRNIKVKFSVYLRSDCVSVKIVHYLTKVGLYCVFLGVESFCQDVLDRYNKGITVENNIKAIKILVDNGVHVRMGMIMFDYDSTPEEIYCTIQNLKAISSEKSDMIFQSLFFSNVLIPLESTPSFDIFNTKIREEKYCNQRLQDEYERRSRCGKNNYCFKSEIVSDIYSCVQYMSDIL